VTITRQSEPSNKVMADEQLKFFNSRGGTERILVLVTEEDLAENCYTRSRGSVLGVNPPAGAVAFASSRWVPHGRRTSASVADVRCLHIRNEFDLVVSFNALPLGTRAGRGLAFYPLP